MQRSKSTDRRAELVLNQESVLVGASSVILNYKPLEGSFPALLMVGLEKEEALIIFLFIAGAP